jgi:hypothetical protein
LYLVTKETNAEVFGDHSEDKLKLEEAQYGKKNEISVTSSAHKPQAVAINYLTIL